MYKEKKPWFLYIVVIVLSFYKSFYIFKIPSWLLKSYENHSILHKRYNKIIISRHVGLLKNTNEKLAISNQLNTNLNL